jgi:hypothetical protein
MPRNVSELYWSVGFNAIPSMRRVGLIASMPPSGRRIEEWR